MDKPPRNGFSIIEFTVVLVIAALLMGGFFVFKDMKQSAEIRATISQVEMLDSAFLAFRLKYNCVPGDCVRPSDMGIPAEYLLSLRLRNIPSATGGNFPSFISMAYAASHADPQHEHEYEQAMAIKPGNGDGKISKTEFESSLFSLVALGMIRGIGSDGKLHPAIKQYSLITKDQGFFYIGYVSANPYTLFEQSGNRYWITSSIKEGGPGASVFEPVIAAKIDIIIDDGLPLDGKVRASGNTFISNPLNGAVIYASDIGPAGPKSNFCITNGSPSHYNTANKGDHVKSQCTLEIMPQF